MRILYLNPNEGLHLTNNSIEMIRHALLKHPETVYYTLDEFLVAFNNEEISDLGYISVVDEETLVKKDIKEKQKEIYNSLTKILTEYEELEAMFKQEKISLRDYTIREIDVRERMYLLLVEIQNYWDDMPTQE